MKKARRIRYLTVYGTGYHEDKVPTIVVKGYWLTKLEFKTGDRIRVECDKGMLTITKADEIMMEGCYL